MLESSTKRGDSSDDEENKTSLAVIASIEIEIHPRKVGYLNIISLYSDNDFYSYFTITRTTFLYVLCYLQDENFCSDIAFHGRCHPMKIAEVLFIS
jgi:hypothetical protein